MRNQITSGAGMILRTALHLEGSNPEESIPSSASSQGKTKKGKKGPTLEPDFITLPVLSLQRNPIALDSELVQVPLSLILLMPCAVNFTDL